MGVPSAHLSAHPVSLIPIPSSASPTLPAWSGWLFLAEPDSSVVPHLAPASSDYGFFRESVPAGFVFSVLFCFLFMVACLFIQRFLFFLCACVLGGLHPPPHGSLPYLVVLFVMPFEGGPFLCLPPGTTFLLLFFFIH